MLYSWKYQNVSPFLYRALLLYRAQNLPSLLFYLQTRRYLSEQYAGRLTCHRNFVIDLAPRTVSIVQW